MGARPDVGDNLDWDETTREYADFLGVSQKLIIATDKMAKVRQERAQQAQAQQAAQMSMAGVQGAKTLSETDVGGGQNALQKMMGYQGAQQ
jgi:hypothetical protein